MEKRHASTSTSAPHPSSVTVVKTPTVLTPMAATSALAAKALSATVRRASTSMNAKQEPIIVIQTLSASTRPAALRAPALRASLETASTASPDATTARWTLERLATPPSQTPPRQDTPKGAPTDVTIAATPSPTPANSATTATRLQTMDAALHAPSKPGGAALVSSLLSSSASNSKTRNLMSWSPRALQWTTLALEMTSNRLIFLSLQSQRAAHAHLFVLRQETDQDVGPGSDSWLSVRFFGAAARQSFLCISDAPPTSIYA